MIRAFIFDQDGVLIDSDQYHYLALKQVLNSVGIAITLNEYTDVCLGKNTEHNIRYFLTNNNQYGNVLESLVSQKRRIYNELVKKEATPMRGVIAALQCLTQYDMKLGVASSSHQQAVDVVLDQLGLTSVFDVVAHAGMVSELKPSPEIYLLAADLLGINPQECIAVEDSNVGLESAISAGMRAMMVSNINDQRRKFPRASWILSSLEDLTPSFLESKILCIL